MWDTDHPDFEAAMIKNIEAIKDVQDEDRKNDLQESFDLLCSELIQLFGWSPISPILQDECERVKSRIKLGRRRCAAIRKWNKANIKGVV